VPTFNLADLFETTADAVGDRLALVAGDARRTYAGLDDRATRLAHHLRGAGLAPGEHVAVLAWNRAEWLEAMLGCWKARLVPINVNYRYTADELRHVLADAEVTALVAESTLLAPLPNVAADLPRLRHVVAIDDGGPVPDGIAAVAYEAALAAAPAGRDGLGPRSGDDRYVLYTGGTTGAPKGVVWRQEDLFFAALGGGNPGGEPVATPEGLAAVLAPERRPWLVTSPLMHGNGQWNSLVPLLTGQGVVLWTGHRFDAAAVARLAAREAARLLVLVGDGMALPFVEAVETARVRDGSTDDPDPDPDLDLERLRVVASGGAILSPVVKERLLALLPRVTIVDGFGASETGSNGRLVGAGDGGPPRFSMGPDTTVLDDDLRPVPPGSGEVGRLARRGHVPLGYWNDPAKTAATFPVDAGGVRWAVPGDLARPEADGTITLLGRGSACINTGGEKVHPEEVAAAVKTHPAVADAFVVSAPDERFGQRVVAVVTLRPGNPAEGTAAPLVLADLRDHLRERLAGYKAPRQLVVAEALRYTPQGKPDLRWAAELATMTPPSVPTTVEVAS
jgi:fatty-acyl-CoA synthase